jgi:hypothetical protein
VTHCRGRCRHGANQAYANRMRMVSATSPPLCRLYRLCRSSSIWNLCNDSDNACAYLLAGGRNTEDGGEESIVMSV